VVERAPELLHGKTSEVHHEDAGVLHGLPDPFVATRYHSLAVREDSLPPSSRSREDGRRGRDGAAASGSAVEGVQFHPESVLTQGGHRLLANWLATCGDRRPERRRLRWLPPSIGSVATG